MSRFVRLTSFVVVPLGLVVVLLLGCVESTSPEPREVQVHLAIGGVPTDVNCIRIGATGAGRTVVRELSVMPGSTVNEAFAGLPVGTVTFLAEAFAGTCEAVTRATIPSWVSDSIPVNISLGRIASVDLVLRRNGRAKVSIGFEEGGDGGAGDGG